MARNNTITVNILGDASGAKRAFGQVQKSANGLGTKMAGVGRKVAKGLAVGVGAVAAGVGALVAGGVKDLINLEKIGAQTASVIKSTGGAANVTAGDVAKLADKLEKLTGIESEGIREGQNLLLTFTNIQNKAGKGNNIFTQSTKILTDMSVALGTDVKSSAIQLGKALNDPVKGVTALTRVGVSFTDQQKEQIEAMAEAGDTAGAQKIILAELNKEFGGSAKAFGGTTAGRMAKFKNAIGDIGEEIASHLLPIAGKLATLLADRFLPVAERFGKQVGPFLVSALEAVSRIVREAVLPILERVRAFIGGSFTPVLIGLGVAIAASVVPPLVAAAAAAAVAVAPFLALAAVVAGAIVIWKKFPIVRQIVGAVADFVVEKVGALVEWWKGIWPQVQEAVIHVFNVISTVVGTVLDGMHRAWAVFGDDLIKVVSGAFAIVQSVVETVIGVVAGIIKTVLAVINGDWGKAWDGIKGIVFTVWEGIKGIVTGAIDVILGVLGGVGNAVASVASGMWDGIKDAFKAALNWIIDRWNGLEFKVPGLDLPGLGKVGGFTLGVPDIPRLAEGGIVNRPTLAVVGERGPEAVIPLDRGGMGSTAATYNINVSAGWGADGREIGEKIVAELKRYERRNGRVSIGVRL